jgi:hypothetical protein
MGYELHITRQEFWADDEGPEITLEEWKNYVATDTSIKLDEENPGGKDYVLYSGQNLSPLWWDERGEIYTKNPEPTVIAKLVQIANALGAKVVGDDDEIYGTDPLDATKAIEP